MRENKSLFKYKIFPNSQYLKVKLIKFDDFTF